MNITNRLTSVIVTLAAITATNTYALPMYYTFHGEVSFMTDSSSGIDEMTGLRSGDSISREIKLLIDQQSEGIIRKNNGDLVIPEQTEHRQRTGEFTYQTITVTTPFYTEMVTELLLNEIMGGSFNNPTDTQASNVGYLADHTFSADEYFFHLGSDDNGVMMQNYAFEAPGLSIGSVWDYTEFAYNQLNERSSLSGTLFLTSISEASLVQTPIPASLPFMLTALVGLGYWRRRCFL